MAPHSRILAWRIPWKRSLVGYGPQGHEELDVAQQAHTGVTVLCEAASILRTGHPNPCPGILAFHIHDKQKLKFCLSFPVTKNVNPAMSR